MNTPEPPEEEREKTGGKQSGLMLLIGFCVAVLLLFALMLNHPAKVAEWASYLRLRGAGRGGSPKNSCIANLKQIDGATQQWALENKKAATDTYSLTDTDLLAYFRGSTLPLCPLGGRYSAGTNVQDVPRCTVPGHTL